MMSASAVRKPREMGGGVAGKVPAVPAKCMSAGKENARSSSRIRSATQKPSLRPMDRIENPAAASDASRARKSTSSVPRGRSTSPAEVRRVFSDLRKSTAVTGPSVGKGNTSNLTEKRRDSLKYMNVSEVASQENEKIKISEVRNSGNEKKELNSSLKLVNDLPMEKQVLNNSNGKMFDDDGHKLRNKAEVKISIRCRKDEETEASNVSSSSKKQSDLEYSNAKPISFSTSKIGSLVRPKIRSSGIGIEVASSMSDSKMVPKISSSSRQNNLNKYPSKLHEKLADLEGKVKRIACDIKRTKEILDMNNTDASKMILSDIQEKVSGIEKAMVHVVKNGEDLKKGSGKLCTNKDEDIKDVMDVKVHLQGLNADKLEDRLFPHHRLIRDRTILKSSGFRDSGTKLCADVNSLSSSVHTVALECLSSSSKTEEYISPDTNKVQEMDESVTSTAKCSSLNLLCGKDNVNAVLISDENLNDFDQENENENDMVLEEKENEDSSNSVLHDIGSKSTTAGWFVSEGEGLLLAHGDGSCSFYDIANSEMKAEYKPPPSIFPNIWRDCWIIRAPGADGSSGKYVVAASAGNSGESGFCSWDFYTKNLRASHFKSDDANVRTALAPLPNNIYRTTSFVACENWYRPCGPLIVSASSSQKKVQVYDIRDGDQVMKWELHKPVLAMDYSSPVQWRNRGKVVMTESDSISLWDVSSMNSQALLSIPSVRKISAMYINNTDAEFGGGVRHRISSNESEGNDGVFCTPDSINVLDFRQPSGIGLKIPKIGVNIQSAFCRGNDTIYIGCTCISSASKRPSVSSIQQFSIRKQKLVCSYNLPEMNAHHNFTELTQVWGNKDYVMGICGLGLFIFDSLKDDDDDDVAGVQYLSEGGGGMMKNAKEVTGQDNMYSPCFDYCSSIVLIISRDRPASWRYLL